MAEKKFRGPGILGWIANESEYRKREAARRKAQRDQMSDRRPKPKPEKPKSWSAQQMEAASQSLSAHASKNHNLNFKDKPQAKPPAKPQPAAAPKPTATTSGGPAPASRPSGGRVTGGGGAAKVTGTSNTSNVGPVASGDDYARNKDPKKYNPLMQKTFGYQTGDAPDQRAAKEKFTGGDQSTYKPQAKVDGSKYEAGKAATNRTGDNNPDVASKASKKYLEEIEKKRKGQSNVIG